MWELGIIFIFSLWHQLLHQWVPKSKPKPYLQFTLLVKYTLTTVCRLGKNLVFVLFFVCFVHLLCAILVNFTLLLLFFLKFFFFEILKFFINFGFMSFAITTNITSFTHNGNTKIVNASSHISSNGGFLTLWVQFFSLKPKRRSYFCISFSSSTKQFPCSPYFLTYEIESKIEVIAPEFAHTGVVLIDIRNGNEDSTDKVQKKKKKKRQSFSKRCLCLLKKFEMIGVIKAIQTSKCNFHLPSTA